MAGTSSLMAVCTKQQRIAKLARQIRGKSLTTLAHYIDIYWLTEAFGRTRRDGAPGVDGETWHGYADNLQANLQALLDRVKSGTYRAPPVRRVRIPKGKGGETRPIGIPTLEDKVLQRAVVMVLEPIYEQEFYHCSYGFRPGRSAHHALQALWDQAMKMQDGWIVEVDIRKFFDTLDHAQLRQLVRKRVGDGVLCRLISKWLHAGVLEGGVLTYPEEGTPQGGVISPLLANIYLHAVLDEWFEQVVKPRLRGRAFLVRYADDFVIGFACEEDARRVLEVLPKRFAKYGLQIHPDKTRLLRFARPQSRPPSEGGPPSESFDFLGFRHYWSRSKKGTPVVKRKTAPDRFRRALTKLTQWCRQNRHEPVAVQHAALRRSLLGHFAYYGRLIGNLWSLKSFVYEVGRVWRYWLHRRRRRGGFNWSRMNRLLKRFALPRPRGFVEPVSV